MSPHVVCSFAQNELIDFAPGKEHEAVAENIKRTSNEAIKLIPFFLFLFTNYSYSADQRKSYYRLPDEVEYIMLIQNEIDIENNDSITKSDTLFKGKDSSFYNDLLSKITVYKSNSLKLKKKCGEDYCTVDLEIFQNSSKKYSIHLEREICVGGTVVIGKSKIEPIYINFPHGKSLFMEYNEGLVSKITDFYWEYYRKYFNGNK